MEAAELPVNGAVVTLVGSIETQKLLDILTIIEDMVVLNFALVTSDPSAGALELSVASGDEKLFIHLEKLKEYASSNHLEISVVRKTLAALRRSLEPTSQHRIIFSAASSELKTNLFPKLEELRQAQLRVVGGLRRGQIIAIDVESDLNTQNLLDALCVDANKHHIAVLLSGVHLRRPRPFIFIGKPNQPLLQELHQRGALVCVIGYELNLDTAHSLAMSDGAKFLELVDQKSLDASESIVIHVDNTQTMPSWLPSNCLTFSTTATSTGTLVLERLDDVLELVSISPNQSHSASHSHGVTDITNFLQLLGDHGPDVSVACTQSSAVWSTASTGAGGYTLTTTSKNCGQKLLGKSLAVLAEFATVTPISGRLLSSSYYSPLPPTADAASLVPLDSFELHINLAVDLNSDILQEIRLKLKQTSDNLKGDAAVQPNSLSRIFRRLAVFDMDSTLVQQECIDEMAEFAGVGDEVKKITLRAMNGELDFEAALRARVALLAGLHAEDLFHRICRNLEYTPGASLMAATLQRLGLTLAVVSGGFTSIISSVKDFLGLHHAHANELEIADAKLTGNLVPGAPIVDSKAKLYHLNRLAKLNQHSLEQSVAVGDGANERQGLE
eukprot:TRINITY_DN11991_c0_g1_i1.p1 TRINITY_DN11991_c0_g1~~TRINITY_DN11991_c0_g1_i1.p1  ORF type:complete len:614 (+),score=57.80 TRINITY_DN11991_c0_g1_i1:46-1887(+)